MKTHWKIALSLGVTYFFWKRRQTIYLDANTGILMKEGMEFQNVLGTVKVKKLLGDKMIADINGVEKMIPLQVRLGTHPSFVGRTVAFLPS